MSDSDDSFHGFEPSFALVKWREQQADLATLRTQLATMTAERDRLQDAYLNQIDRAVKAINAAEAALAKVAMLRDALGLIHMRSARWSPSRCLARNALEATK